MLVGVILVKSLVNLKIPVKWLLDIPVDQLNMHGVNSEREHTIFYCNDSSKNARFDLPLANVFDPQQEACYKAYIKRFFSE